MKRKLKPLTFTIILVHLLLSGNFSFSQTFNWAKQFGGPGNEHGHAIATDNSGNIILAGDFSATCHFDSYVLTPQAVDMYVTKFDSSGNVIWAINLSGPGFSDVIDLKTDLPGNIYICGTFENSLTIGSTTLTSNGSFDAFVAKLDNNGNGIFALNIGGAGFDDASSLDVDVAENIFVVGTFGQTVQFGPQSLTSTGGSDIFLSKINSSGSIAWAKKGGGISDDYANELKIFVTSSVTISGTFQNDAAFSSTNLSSSGVRDIFLAKYDTSGVLLWAKAYGDNSANGEYFNSISIDNTGNIFACGKFDSYTKLDAFNLISNGADDVVVARLDANGNTIWAKSGGGVSTDIAMDGMLDNSNNYYVSGQFSNLATFDTITLNSLSASDPDILILKCDASGTILWAQQCGGAAGYDEGRAITVSNDKIFLSGSFNTSATFGSINLPHVYDSDNIFLAELNAADSLTGVNEITYPSPVATVFPNPASGFITVRSPVQPFALAELFNPLGEKIYTQDLKGRSETISINNIPPGLYLLKLSFSSGEYFNSKSLIIKTR